MLQSLSGKLSRLNDVSHIGLTIAEELRLLVDYHNCRVFLRDEVDLVPVAFRGDLTNPDLHDPVRLLPTTVGRGITGTGDTWHLGLGWHRWLGLGLGVGGGCAGDGEGGKAKGGAKEAHGDWLGFRKTGRAGILAPIPEKESLSNGGNRPPFPVMASPYPPARRGGRNSAHSQ